MKKNQAQNTCDYQQCGKKHGDIKIRVINVGRNMGRPKNTQRRKLVTETN